MNTLQDIATSCSNAYRAAKRTIGTSAKHPISEDAYYECLGVVPPIYGNGKIGQFWVGEAYDDDHNYQPRYLECWREDDTYYCRISRVVR